MRVLIESVQAAKGGLSSSPQMGGGVYLLGPRPGVCEHTEAAQSVCAMECVCSPAQLP